MRRFSLWATLAGLALLSVTESAPDPPLCRVTAEYRPVSWPEWTDPAERFRRITVRLRPDCLNGQAHVYLTHRSGRRLPESGHYTLTPARPVLNIPSSPPYAVTTPGWTVWWVKRSTGQRWAVSQTQLPPLGGGP